MAEFPVSPTRIGVDAGGTFTDIVIVDATGDIRAYKSPSVPTDPATGVLNAIAYAGEKLALSAQELLGGCELFVHGSTVATNTLLERKGATTALICTRGFRDSLEMRRGIRANVWDHRTPPPEVIVPRYLRFGLGGRLAADGSEIEPVDLGELRDICAAMRREHVESVAICLLHCYVNPDHEYQVRDFVEQELPGVFVSCSADVAPIIGEYERSSTVAINAYVAPRMVPYLQSLNARLSGLGLRNHMQVVQSNGGSTSAAQLAQRPSHLVLSGPSAGVGSLKYFASDTSSENLLSIEIGGTSCDVMVYSDGQVAMTDQVDIDGHHLAVPAVEIHTIGAGGGTIGRVDAAGLIHAGPEGAGALPGPACYGRGGELPTVTDAQLVLGRLRDGPYAGGAISLDSARASAAIATHLAQPLGLDILQVAAGMIRLVEQNIQQAVERVSIERGYNPQSFTLVAAGGAGPLHGASVAKAIGCKAAYVPRLAGVFCAFGMCNSDIRHDYVRTWLHTLDRHFDRGGVEMAFGDLEGSAQTLLKAQGFSDQFVDFRRKMNLRYRGQQWAVTVDTPVIEDQAILESFSAEHEKLFGFHNPRSEVDIVNLNLAAIGKQRPLQIPAVPKSTAVPVPVETRPVWEEAAAGMIETPVYDGTVLAHGQTISGPAIIDEATTTIHIGTGALLRMTPASNYLIEV